MIFQIEVILFNPQLGREIIEIHTFPKDSCVLENESNSTWNSYSYSAARHYSTDLNAMTDDYLTFSWGFPYFRRSVRIVNRLGQSRVLLPYPRVIVSHEEYDHHEPATN